MSKSSTLGRLRTANASDDMIVNQSDLGEKRVSRNFSGVVVAVVVLFAFIFVLYTIFSWNSKKGVEGLEPNLTSGLVDLPSLAEQHYGNRAFWIYIFDANSDKLDSPINIDKDISLVFPDLKSEYDVDVTDSMAIRKARIEANLVLTRIKNNSK